MALLLMHLDDVSFESKPQPESSFRGLTLANDSQIRSEMFSATANLLKKIRKLEKDHESFVRCDQLLYEDWYNLTFRHQRLEVEQMERRFRTLSTFNLHLKYIAETSNVSLERAYMLLKEEEHQYQNGDEDWKFVIEKLRQHRLECAKSSPLENGAPAQENSEKPGTLFNSGEAVNQVGIAGLNRRSRSVFYYLKEIDDEMMVRHLADSTSGYDLFKDAFQIVMKCGDWGLLTRLWKNSGSAYQQKLLKPMPNHLKDFLHQMILNAESEERRQGEQQEAEVALRSTYRKLARLLHPDMRPEQVSAEFQEWLLKIWQKVQAVYKAKDLQGLKRLELICMAQLGQLNNLTLDEIYQSSLVFAEELETLKKNLRSYRKHPAWRFSSRRGYEALKMRLSRDLKKKAAPLQKEVSHLEVFLRKLEAATLGMS